MKLLIVGCASWSFKFIQYLIGKSESYAFVADERIPLKEQGLSPRDYDTVICNSLFLYNDIREFVNLKRVFLTSAGLDRIPLDYIEERKIEVVNARGVYSIPMAEYAVFGVMELYKRAKFLIDSQSKSLWEKQRDIREIYGKTVCIVGAGNVGTEVAKRFSAFGTRVIGVDIAKITSDLFEEKYSVFEIGEALSKSDIVILTLPLTEKTEKLFDEKMFLAMKDGAVFVNIARGKIVDEKALIRAIKEKLFGAVLDVFESEPLDEKSELWSLPNVIVTPHNSFVGEGNVERLEKVISGNL